MCIEYHIQVNMYHVSARGVDERMRNVHWYVIIIVLCVQVLFIRAVTTACPADG